jgi:hypothetical protein
VRRSDGRAGGQRGRLALALCLVEGGAGSAVERVEIVPVRRSAGDAGAMRRAMRAGRLNAVDQGLRGAHVGVGDQHRELVAADSAERIRGAKRYADAVGSPGEQFVSGDVSVGVVVGLEVVEIDDHQGDRPAEAIDRGQLGRRGGVEAAAVQGAGERVGHGRSGQLASTPFVIVGLPPGRGS